MTLRNLLKLSALAAVVASTSGTADEGLSTLPMKRTVITVAAFPAFDASVKVALVRWEALHPEIRVTLVSRPFSEHNRAMVEALASGTNLPDVIGVDTALGPRNLRQMEETDGLENLDAPPYDAETLTPELLDFSLAQARWKDQLVAIPANVGPGTLLYRKDLLEKSKVSEADLTRSWDSYLEAGKKVKAATGAFLLADARDLADIYVRTHVPPGEGIFFDADGEPQLDAPRFQEAFALALRARDAGLDANASAWSNDWVDGLRRGRIATQPYGQWFIPHMAAFVAKESSGQWRAAQLPAGAFASWGGAFWAIPKGAAHKMEAWAFIQFLCFDRHQQEDALRAKDAWPALKAAQDASVVDEPVKYLGGQTARQLFRASAAAIPNIPVNQFDPVASNIIDSVLLEVLGGEDIQAALADAQARLKASVHEQEAP